MKTYEINSQLDADITTLSALYQLVLGVPFKSFDKLKNTSILNIRLTLGTKKVHNIGKV